MTPIFADINAITGIGGLVIGIGALAVAIVVASKKQDVKVTPDPLRVSAAEQFAHKHELDRVEREVISLSSDRKKEAGVMHEKINSVDRKVAGLERDTVLQNQRLASMDSKLDRLIENR